MSTELSDRAAWLQHQREQGRSSIVRGTILLVSIPLVIMAAFAIAATVHALAPFFIAGAYAIVGGAAGIVTLGVGMLESRSARKQLVQLEADRIPAARLLKE
ncbi:MAG TPA: hypothetical protein VGC41_11280 [Kofleriaceae bacterium]